MNNIIATSKAAAKLNHQYVISQAYVHRAG